LYANLFQLRNYIEAHVTEIKQLQDVRKGTAPFVSKMLKSLFLPAKTYVPPVPQAVIIGKKSIWVTNKIKLQ
jgi:hypothetical protein